MSIRVSVGTLLAVGAAVSWAVMWQCAAAQSAGQPDAGKSAAPTESKRSPAATGIQFETSYEQIASGPWKGRRLPDGQPDVSGDWSNTVANHDNFTDPQGGIPGDPQGNRKSRGARDQRAPSRVTDPADGQVPFQPWARAKQQEFLAGLFDAVRPEYIEPLARCAPAGVPKSLYWHGYEIRQYPGLILFLFNSGWRIIYLQNKQHLPAALKLWNGDSRGHWEGNTLVVDVDNLNGKARFGRTGEFASENVHVVERYIFAADNKHYNYVATFTDPTVFTRPFTVTIPAKRWTVADKPNEWHYEVQLANNPNGAPIGDHYERICVENNGPFGQLSVTAGR